MIEQQLHRPSRRPRVGSSSSRNGQTEKDSTRVNLGASPEDLKFVNQLKEALDPIYYDGYDFYMYDRETGCQEKSLPEKVGQRIQQLLPEVDNKPRNIGFYVKLLKYTGYREVTFYRAIRMDREDFLVNLRNCIRRYVRKENKWITESHDPKWMFNKCLDLEYDPNADCPLLKSELKEKLPDSLDRQAILFFGATGLIPDCRFEKALCCFGPTKSGKSTIMIHGIGSVFRGLIGSLTLPQICNVNRGSNASPVGKLEHYLFNIGGRWILAKFRILMF
jgi:putative DNA primase/helicase